MWQYLKDKFTAKDETIHTHMGMLLKPNQRTVFLLGQVMNSITIRRHFNLLITIMPYSELKTILKEKLDILEDKGYLFGKEFHNHLTEVRRAKHRKISIMKLTKRFQFQSPFNMCPHLVTREMVGQNRFVFNLKDIKMENLVKELSKVNFLTAP